MGHQEFFRLFPAKCELKKAGFDVNLGLDLPIEMGVWPTRDSRRTEAMKSFFDFKFARQYEAGQLRIAGCRGGWAIGNHDAGLACGCAAPP